MNTITDRGDWCQTFTGRQFFPLDPTPESICIEDIAHALGMLCRFSGHIRKFYSVAQHSVFVASLLPATDPSLQLAGLLHDATEAYLVDIPRPLKVALPDYRAIEYRLAEVISEKFGVDLHDARIKHADNVALMTEARDLLGPTPAEWGVREAPHPLRLHPLSPERASGSFLAVFNELTRSIT